MNDRQIVDLFFARSQDAIGEAREKYEGKLLRLATKITGNRLDAEECVNDAFLVAWNSIPPQRPDPLSTWLYKTVRNKALDRWKTLLATMVGAAGGAAAIGSLHKQDTAAVTEDAAEGAEETEDTNLASAEDYNPKYSLWIRSKTAQQELSQDFRAPAYLYALIPLALVVLVLGLSLVMVDRNLKIEPIYLLSTKQE